MTPKCRYLLDENIAYTIKQPLIQLGVDIVHLQDTLSKGASDIEIIRFCYSDSRVIVTSDTDFLILADYFQTHVELFAGIVFA